MAEITAKTVQELRQKTGAGMMDCKKALTESNGDVEGAIDWLRKKGLSQAAKKAGRVAAEGVISLAFDNGKGAMVEVNSETDFVARNDEFQDFAKRVSQLALTEGKETDSLLNALLDNKKVSDVLTDKIASIGENIQIRRSVLLEGENVVGYVHGAIAENMGKIGVLVSLKGDSVKAADVGKKIAMHIAAAKPDFLSIADVDSVVVEKEKKVLSEQALASGKPESVVEKMIEGRIHKFYEEIVLLEQAFVMEPKKKVKDVLSEAGVELVGFEHFILGAGAI
ncbi:MAG: elongation factor Ts [Alphaproteobacteria bacterium]|nr:elongation factor Ts [Alphaproteobacteria bacterium]